MTLLNVILQKYDFTVISQFVVILSSELKKQQKITFEFLFQ